MTSAMRFSAVAGEARSANVRRAMSALIMSSGPQALAQAAWCAPVRIKRMQSFPCREMGLLTALGARLHRRRVFGSVAIWSNSRHEHVEEKDEEQSGRQHEHDKEHRQFCSPGSPSRSRTAKK